MSFPIYINNRDRLTFTRTLADQCSKLHFVDSITIVDNDSSYPPLLDWYASCPYRVVRLKENRGPRAPWTLDDIPPTYHVVTDSDLDIGSVPLHALDVLHDGLQKYPEIIKAGLSLEINDLPDGYPLKSLVLSREAEMWEPYQADVSDNRFCLAPIDTTFAMYRPMSGWAGYIPSLRLKRPYTAKHMPWYATEENEEETYYLKHLNPEGVVYSAIAQEKYRT